MYDLHFATNDICIAPRLANLALKVIDGLMKKKHAQIKRGRGVGAMPPDPLSLKTRRGGGGGSHTRTGPGRPPVPPTHHQMKPISVVPCVRACQANLCILVRSSIRLDQTAQNRNGHQRQINLPRLMQNHDRNLNPHQDRHQNQNPVAASKDDLRTSICVPCTSIFIGFTNLSVRAVYKCYLGRLERVQASGFLHRNCTSMALGRLIVEKLGLAQFLVASATKCPTLLHYCKHLPCCVPIPLIFTAFLHASLFNQVTTGAANKIGCASKDNHLRRCRPHVRICILL